MSSRMPLCGTASSYTVVVYIKSLMTGKIFVIKVCVKIVVDSDFYFCKKAQKKIINLAIKKAKGCINLQCITFHRTHTVCKFMLFSGFPCHSN